MVVVVHIVLQVIRERAVVSAPQASNQHRITASGEKYTLPDKLAAKNKPVSTCLLCLQLDWRKLLSYRLLPIKRILPVNNKQCSIRLQLVKENVLYLINQPLKMKR